MPSAALKFPKSLWSYNPIPAGCVFYAPLWSPNLGGPVFKTPDSFGHVCTVTGALARARGRFFDGGGAADDVIEVGVSVALDSIFDGGGTAIFWVNVVTDGEGNNGYLIEKVMWNFATFSDDLSAVKLRFTAVFFDTNGLWTTTAVSVTLNTWSMVSVTYNSDDTINNPIIYVDTATPGLTEDTTPVGTRVSDEGKPMTLGNTGPGRTRTLDGTIGEAYLYNRLLIAAEITYIYEQTRGRFS